MSINEGLWSAKLPSGDVRSGTLEQLSEAFRAGHIGGGTLVCAAGSANWIRLADVLGSAAAFTSPAAVAPPRPSAPPAQPAVRSAPPPPVQSAPPPAVQSVPPGTNGGSEVWQVRLATGEVRNGTRQQLEEAVRSGLLPESAQALAPGAREWIRVGSLLARSQPPAAPVIPPTYAPAPLAPPRASVPAAALPPPASAAPPPVGPPAAAARPDGGDSAWQVRLGNGEVRSGTRQQLEEAFNAGHLDGSALVLAAGMSEWVALGELMDRRPQEPVPAPVAAPEPPPLVAAEPPPVIAAEPAPVVTQVVAQEAAPAPAPAETAQEAPAPEAPTDEQTSADSAQVDAPELWQVKLTLKQLEDAFNAGLIEDDTPVLAAGADEWVELGTLRREQPAPFGDAVGVPSSQDGAPAEPASRTEPWPATLAGNSHSPTGE